MKLVARFSRRMCLAFAIAGLLPVLAAQSLSLPEPVEWTWEVRPPSPLPDLPNVLLLGDSITRAYYPQVSKDLEGIANIYLMATSTSIGDPRLPRQIAEFGCRAHGQSGGGDHQARALEVTRVEG